ncbi:MAG: hypothetical protein ABEH56_04170 [Salinirussus sp.]
MTDRIPSDHGAVTSHRTELGTVGRTRRPRIPLPAALECDVGDVIRLSLAGQDCRVQVTADLHGEPDVRGAYPNPRLARADGREEDELAGWLDDRGVTAGETLVLDVVTSGYGYGIREPGERVVYRAVDPPERGLADIARRVERE